MSSICSSELLWCEPKCTLFPPKTGPINVVLPKLANPPAEVEVGGIYLPEGTLTSNAEVAYVLNQVGGMQAVKQLAEWSALAC